MSGIIEQLQEALRPRLGQALVERTPLCAGVRRLLLARDGGDYAQLTRQVESYLFNALYALLGEDMTVRLAPGRLRRISLEELPALADAAVGVLFARLPCDAVSYARLRDHFLRTGSLSALRTLTGRFAAFHSPQEQALLTRILADRAPLEDPENAKKGTDP